MGARDADTVSSLAGRLARLGKQLTKEEAQTIKEKTDDLSIEKICSALVTAIDPDTVEEKARDKYSLQKTDEISENQYKSTQSDLVGEAAKPLNADLINYLVETQQQKEQTIDHDNLDQIIYSGSSQQAFDKARGLTTEFEQYLEDNKDEIHALTIYFNEPHRRSEITFKMIKDVFTKLKSEKPNLMPLRVWESYQRLEKTTSGKPISELTALVSLVRKVCKVDEKLKLFEDCVRKNFQDWIMTKHSGKNPKFTQEQMEWLRAIRDHIVTSFHIEKEDFGLSPFDQKGGLGKLHKLFGNEMTSVIDELNQALVA